MKKLCALALCLALCVGLLPSAAWAAGPEVKAKAVLLMEKSTGDILYEEHGEEPLELASVTKVMTMLLIMEALEDGTLTPDTMVAVSANAAGMGGSQVYMKEGETFSVHDMLKAIAVASRKFPLVNARYEEDEVRVYKHTNVGLAVALDGALVVPVVKEIDAKGLEQIAGDYKEQINKARAGKLAPADMGCGSITISNLGMYDVDQFIAIDNPPESCILAVGSIKVKPEWDGEKFVPANMMTVTGSFDHRIIDGAYGAQFLQELKTLMEEPSLMLY